MSTYRLTDDDRETLLSGAVWATYGKSAEALFAAVESIIAPIHARAEEAEDKAKTASDALDACPEILRLAEMSDAVSGWKARAEAAEKRADDLAAVVRSALAAWDSPGLTYGATAKVFDDLRTALADPAAVLADRDRRMKAEAWDVGYEAGYGDAEFNLRGTCWDADADEHPHANPYRAEGGRADD